MCCGVQVTPLHHDPHHNFLAQVVGHKYIRIYHPEQDLHSHTEGHNTNSSRVSRFVCFRQSNGFLNWMKDWMSARQSRYVGIAQHAWFVFLFRVLTFLLTLFLVKLWSVVTCIGRVGRGHTRGSLVAKDPTFLTILPTWTKQDSRLHLYCMSRWIWIMSMRQSSQSLWHCPSRNVFLAQEKPCICHLNTGTMWSLWKPVFQSHFGGADNTRGHVFRPPTIN